MCRKTHLRIVLTFYNIFYEIHFTLQSSRSFFIDELFRRIIILYFNTSCFQGNHVLKAIDYFEQLLGKHHHSAKNWFWKIIILSFSIIFMQDCVVLNVRRSITLLINFFFIFFQNHFMTQIINESFDSGIKLQTKNLRKYSLLLWNWNL